MNKLFHYTRSFALIFFFVFGLSMVVTPTSVSAAGKCIGGHGPDAINQTVENVGQCDTLGKEHGFATTYIPDRKAGETSTTTPAKAVGGGSNDPGFWAGIIETAAAWLMTIVLRFVSLLTGLAAVLLNGVIYLTVVKMAEGYRNLPAIDATWKVMRDVVNMGFIFVLMYEGIQVMLGKSQNAQRKIVSIVVVAVLINFSLFFTKFVIDISNVLALTFYDAIAPGALNSTGTWDLKQAGLSEAFMQYLDLTSLYNTDGHTINPIEIITVGIMGSIMLLIAAFIFFAAAFLFLIRYVILIMVLILSPVAFASFALPNLEDPFKRWKEALINQSFFAPIYFMMTWVTLKVLASITEASQLALGPTGNIADVGSLGFEGTAITASQSFFATFVNYAIVIAFLIFSLVVSKQFAGKTGFGLDKLTSWATNKAGSMSFGLAASAGRQSVGRIGQAVGDSEALKSAMNWSNKRGGLTGAVAGFGVRRTMNAGRAVGASSFDMRATGLNSQLQAGPAGGKGGFVAVREQKAKDEAKFAGSLAPSTNAKGKAARKLEKATAAHEATEKAARLEAENAFASQRRDIATAERMAANPTLSEEGRKAAQRRATELKAQYEEKVNQRAKATIEGAGTAERVQKAQEKVDRVEGVSADEKKRRADQAIKSDAAIKESEEKQKAAEEKEKTIKEKQKEDPAIKKEEEMKKEIEGAEQKVAKLGAEIEKSVSPLYKESLERDKAQMEREIADKKEAMEEAKKAADERRKEIEGEIVAVKDEALQAKKEGQERAKTIRSQYGGREKKDGNWEYTADKNVGEKRKEAFAESTKNSIVAKIGGYNYEAAAQIRKGKKGVKELVDEALKASGEVKEDDKPKEEPKPEAPKSEGDTKPA